MRRRELTVEEQADLNRRLARRRDLNQVEQERRDRIANVEAWAAGKRRETIARWAKP